MPSRMIQAIANDNRLTTDQPLGGEDPNMDENVGKSPDRVENAEWQNRLKLDAEGVSDDFALASDGQAMTSSSADTAKDEPGQAAGPARNEILPHSLRLPMIAAALAATAALGSFAGSLTGSGVTQFWPRF